jgi:hypothetical protein
MVRGFVAIELARTPAWVHEKRGPDGLWIGSGGGSSAIMQRAARNPNANSTSAALVQRKHAAAIRQQRADVATVAQAITGSGPHPASPAAIAHENVAVSEMAARNHAQNVLAQAQTQIAHISDQLVASRHQEEAQKHRVKLALHAVVIAAGAALAMVLAKMDVSPAIEAIGAAAPLIVQELIDWKKRLLWPRSAMRTRTRWPPRSSSC